MTDTNALRAARESAGYSRQVAATHVGLSTRTLTNYETGEQSPRLDTLKDLAALYGCSLRRLCQ